MDDEEVLTPDSISPLTNAANANYKPTAVHQPRWDPFQQNVPKTPSGPVAERLIHGVQREWGQEDPHKPLVFPLRGQATPQLSPVQPQPTFLGVASASAEGSSYESPTVHYAPSSSRAAESPSIESWQPDSGGYDVVDNTDSSAAGNNDHLVYEEVFRYPNSAEPSQSYDGTSNAAGGYGQVGQGRQEASTRDASAFREPLVPWQSTNAGARPIYPARMEDFLGGMNFNFGPAGYRPRDDGASLQPQKAAKTEKVEVSQRVSEPVFPPAPPPSYIIQSRNSYQRGWRRLANSKYTPEFNAAVPMSSNGAKGSATSPPAAPKGVANPQRYSCQKLFFYFFC